jgi:hypothetical protein
LINIDAKNKRIKINIKKALEKWIQPQI